MLRRLVLARADRCRALACCDAPGTVLCDSILDSKARAQLLCSVLELVGAGNDYSFLVETAVLPLRITQAPSAQKGTEMYPLNSTCEGSCPVSDDSS